MASRFKGSVLGVLVGITLLGLPAVCRADSFQLNLSAPNFLIPLAGQDGSLTIYSDGRAATTTGFNALGTQTFTLAGNSTSTGNLTLNMYFSGFPLGRPDQVITDAFLHLTVRDFDFLTDQVTQEITLTEMAILKTVNGTPIVNPINLAAYLPAGTTVTDDRTITLLPIDLMPPLSAGDFTDPFILSFRLTATAINRGSQAVSATNTPEGIFAGVALTGDFTPKSVPEPASLLLLGLGLSSGFGAKGWKERRRR